MNVLIFDPDVVVDTVDDTVSVVDSIGQLIDNMKQVKGEVFTTASLITAQVVFEAVKHGEFDGMSIFFWNAVERIGIDLSLLEKHQLNVSGELHGLMVSHLSCIPLGSGYKLRKYRGYYFLSQWTHFTTDADGWMYSDKYIPTLSDGDCEWLVPEHLRGIDPGEVEISDELGCIGVSEDWKESYECIEDAIDCEFV